MHVQTHRDWSIIYGLLVEIPCGNFCQEYGVELCWVVVDAVWCGEVQLGGVYRACVAGSILEMAFRCGSGAGSVRLSVGAWGQQRVREVWTGLSWVKGLIESWVRMGV